MLLYRFFLLLSFFFSVFLFASEPAHSSLSDVIKIEDVAEIEKIYCGSYYASYENARKLFSERRFAQSLNILDQLTQSGIVPAMLMRAQIAAEVHDELAVNDFIPFLHASGYPLATLFVANNLYKNAMRPLAVSDRVIFQLRRSPHQSIIESFNDVSRYMHYNPDALEGLKRVYPIYSLASQRQKKRDKSVQASSSDITFLKSLKKEKKETIVFEQNEAVLKKEEVILDNQKEVMPPSQRETTVIPSQEKIEVIVEEPEAGPNNNVVLKQKAEALKKHRELKSPQKKKIEVVAKKEKQQLNKVLHLSTPPNEKVEEKRAPKDDQAQLDTRSLSQKHLSEGAHSVLEDNSHAQSQQLQELKKNNQKSRAEKRKHKKEKKRGAQRKKNEMKIAELSIKDFVEDVGVKDQLETEAGSLDRELSLNRQAVSDQENNEKKSDNLKLYAVDKNIRKIAAKLKKNEQRRAHEGEKVKNGLTLEDQSYSSGSWDIYDYVEPENLFEVLEVDDLQAIDLLKIKLADNLLLKKRVFFSLCYKLGFMLNGHGYSELVSSFNEDEKKFAILAYQMGILHSLPEEQKRYPLANLEVSIKEITKALTDEGMCLDHKMFYVQILKSFEDVDLFLSLSLPLSLGELASEICKKTSDDPVLFQESLSALCKYLSTELTTLNTPEANKAEKVFVSCMMRFGVLMPEVEQHFAKVQTQDPTLKLQKLKALGGILLGQWVLFNHKSSVRPNKCYYDSAIFLLLDSLANNHMDKEYSRADQAAVRLLEITKSVRFNYFLNLCELFLIHFGSKQGLPEKAVKFISEQESHYQVFGILALQKFHLYRRKDKLGLKVTRSEVIDALQKSLDAGYILAADYLLDLQNENTKREVAFELASKGIEKGWIYLVQEVRKKDFNNLSLVEKASYKRYVVDLIEKTKALSAPQESWVSKMRAILQFWLAENEEIYSQQQLLYAEAYRSFLEISLYMPMDFEVLWYLNSMKLCGFGIGQDANYAFDYILDYFERSDVIIDISLLKSLQRLILRSMQETKSPEAKQIYLLIFTNFIFIDKPYENINKFDCLSHMLAYENFIFNDDIELVFKLDVCCRLVNAFVNVKQFLIDENDIKKIYGWLLNAKKLVGSDAQLLKELKRIVLPPIEKCLLFMQQKKNYDLYVKLFSHFKSSLN